VLLRRARASLAPLGIAVLVSSLGLSAACGSKTALLADARPDGGGALCRGDEDCPGIADRCHPVHCDTSGFCFTDAPVVCAPPTACGENVCDPASGACKSTSSALDLDHDGHFGPVRGKSPGDPDACGDDCDDTSAAAYPGAKEVCDGVDNDCNGVVDDGAEYVPETAGGPPAVRVSGTDNDSAEYGSLAYHEGGFLGTWTGNASGKARPLLRLLDTQGNTKSPETRLTQGTTDGFTGGAAWTGDRYGIVREERRSNDYDVYFALFNPAGQKLVPGDVAVANEGGYQINARVAWTGRDFVVVWQGEKRVGLFPTYIVRARRVALDGTVAGPIVDLTSSYSEVPVVAVGRSTLGVVYSAGTDTDHHVWFIPIDPQTLAALHAPVEITKAGEQGIFRSVVWNGDAYVATWWEKHPGGSSVHATRIDEAGKVVTPPRNLTDGTTFARDPAIVSLGDRLLAVWADLRDDNVGYELYSRMLSPDLSPRSAGTRITTAQGDSVAPSLAFGPGGAVGVLFRDDRTASAQLWFTHLVCRTK
jgi:hypothetical protein